MQILVIILSVFLLTYFGIRLYLKWSLDKEIYDIPNERSSHQEPTPRGGGLAIVIVCLTVFFLWQYFDNQTVAWAYLAGAFFVALISWLDDLYSLPVLLRFFCQTLAALLVIFFEGFPQTFNLPWIGVFDLGIFSGVFWFLWIVWFINAFNFMDGIDGIAGIQSLTAGVAWAILGYLSGTETAFYLGLIIAVSSFAFLLYNWQPAKIFMGDVGSAFLGYSFAVLPLLTFDQAAKNTEHLWLVGILFNWIFVFDSVKTLFQRIIERKKFWKPHREHLYQKLVIHGFSHASVSLIYGSLNAVISLFLILSGIYGKPFGWLAGVIIIISSITLLVGVEYLSAGEKLNEYSTN